VSPSFASAFLLVILGGALTGVFTGPMKFLTRWRWENIWLVYATCAMFLIPSAVILAVIPNLPAIYAALAPSRALLILACGFLWGIGSVLFGLGVDRLGMGLGFALIMGISTLFGAVLPLFLSESVEIKTFFYLCGMSLLLAGVAVSGYAGSARERSNAGAGVSGRNYATGILICVLSGVLSSLFNIGMVVARPVQELASSAGAPGWASGNAVWPMLLFGGFLANAAYCGRLLRKNNTAGLFLRGGWREWCGAIAMGAAWIAGVMSYGAGAWFMGALGPIVGWPVFTSLMLVCAYLLGRFTGEWRGVAPATLRWMNAGVALSVLSLFLIALSK